MVRECHRSERRACALVGISRDGYRNPAPPSALNVRLSAQIIDIAPKRRRLDQAAQFRGYPKAIRSDNSPEFTSRTFAAWANKHNIKHILIEPSSPKQNAYIESFNGTFRDECLNEQWFTSLVEARFEITRWR